MKKLNINYNEYRNCFEDIRNIKSDLIWGDPGVITDPWFSYIVPVYKRADLLKETLMSIIQQQPVEFKWDIVVVDNECGGENDTERLISDLNDRRILYYRNRENLGPDGNYNRCIELARGKWLGMVHGDDLVIEDHLKRMGNYIKQNERGRKELAYISPRYSDFSNSGMISLKRGSWDDTYIAYKGKLKRYRQIDCIITGYSVGLPSFGTVMNRDVMLETGGFNENLGICEDVITPYKLMKKYRVFVTPELMGYHRFDGNESIKTKTVFSICEAMTDFREYLFSRNILSRIWGVIARPVLFEALTEYCSYLSRFGKRTLNKSDFQYIYPGKRKANEVSSFLFDVVLRIYCFLTGAVSFTEGVEHMVDIIADSIKKFGTDFLIIYGAGKAGKNAEKVLRRKYGIRTEYFAVTDTQTDEKYVNGIRVVGIDELRCYNKSSLVVIAVTIPEFFDDMYVTLKKMGFENIIALDRRFRRSDDLS